MMHRFAVPDLGVRGHDPSALSDRLEYLRRHRYRLLSMVQLLERLSTGEPFKDNAVVFTVDDGYDDFAEIAAPVFAAYDCPVTVFLVTDFVSGRSWNWFDRMTWAFEHSSRRELVIEIQGERESLRWSNSFECARAADDTVERLKRVPDTAKEELMGFIERALEVQIPARAPRAYQAMTWDQVRDCARRGATFGPHTLTHPILSQVDDDRSDREISESWEAVAAATDAAVPVFCYPNGTAADFSSREKRSVARAGMTAGVSTIEGSVQSAPDRLAIPRYGYPEGKSRFVQIASGMEELKTRMRNHLL